VLRGGPDGVRRWNARPASDRVFTKLGRGDYAGCDLAGINFHGQTVTGFRAAGANLAGAILTKGGFISGDFRGADLTSAEMEAFCGRDADFTGAKLVGSDLTRGRLARAKFVGADLTRADLTRADLTGADLTDAVLTDVTLAELVFDQTTAWPAGYEVPGEVKWTPNKPDPRFIGVGDEAVAANIEGLMARLHKKIDPGRMERTLDMLKSGRNQLFSEVESALVRGIVRSQREEDLIYSCVLLDDGTYACCTPDLAECMGLRGEPCKHILVLVIGLARAGQLDPTTADKWVVAAGGKKHRWNEVTQNHVTDTLLKYKGAEAGEIDWRPTETIPEDFYAM
jgi:hypothetical protein